MAVTLTYVNPAGKSITFETRRRPDGEHPPFLLNGISGLGGPDTEYDNLQLTGSNGNAIGEARYPARFIRTECMIYGMTDAERDENLRAALAVLNPQLGNGVIWYKNHEGEYTIEGRAASLPSFGIGTKIGNWKPVIIDYVCGYPLFKGQLEASAVVALRHGSFTLPLRLPFSLGSQTYQGVATNYCDMRVPIEVLVHGPSTNPAVVNKTTGDTIYVRQSIAEGEVLKIVTGPTISVTITRLDGAETDALNYVDLLNTAWIWLAPGENQLTYSSDNAADSTNIEVFWSDWYLGVG